VVSLKRIPLVRAFCGCCKSRNQFVGLKRTYARFMFVVVTRNFKACDGCACAIGSFLTSGAFESYHFCISYF